MGVFIKRGTMDTQRDTGHLWAQKRGSELSKESPASQGQGPWEKPCVLNLHLRHQPPELWETQFCGVVSPIMWYVIETTPWLHSKDLPTGVHGNFRHGDWEMVAVRCSWTDEMINTLRPVECYSVMKRKGATDECRTWMNVETYSQKPRMQERVLFDSAYVKLEKNQIWSVIPESSTDSHRGIEGRLGGKGR